MAKVKFVIKRTGAVVPFNADRISNAIYRAAVAVGGRDKEKAESLAEQVRFNRCLVSETVFASAGSDFNLCEFGEVELKGKQKPVIVYQMIS